MEHPYPFQLFAAVATFGLVFRAQLAYARYWEGRGALASVGMKWTDAAIQIRSFSSLDPSLLSQVAYLDASVTHLLSLMHAINLQTLRGDFPSLAAAGNIIPDEGSASQPPSHDTTVGLKRRTRLFHTFLSNASDTANYKQLVYYNSKFPVIGGLSDDERNSLFTESSRGNDRIAKIMEVLLRLITTAQKRGIIDAPGPIVSRVYQVLSEGNERGVGMSRKIAETPFPLPFAQICELFVTVFILTVPFLLSSWLSGGVVTTLSTFIISWTYLGLNEVSRTLEEPFGADCNDLPLNYLQWEFNRRIETSEYSARGGGYGFEDEGVKDGN
jgi:predicted membrane chloride channel (bestrophin family)